MGVRPATHEANKLPLPGRKSRSRLRLNTLSIGNYKSLRKVTFEPSALTVMAGPNGSGKSNFADALDFISEVYRHGLEVAVASKGGYENIAHRKMRRTKSPISISVRAELDRGDSRFPNRTVTTPRHFPAQMRIEHSFSLLAEGSSIRADYRITSEVLWLYEYTTDSARLVLHADRHGDKIKVSTTQAVEELPPQQSRLYDTRDFEYFASRDRSLAPTDLFLSAVGRFTPALSTFTSAIGRMRIFQIHPNISRDEGVPGPRPELSRNGSNLPAVIDSLRKRSPRAWAKVLELMRAVLPSLSNIEVAYTPSRRLGLFFYEDGTGRPWSVGEISDGTIQTLALLVALFEPQSTLLLIEEIENSVHPWIIRNLVDACKEVSVGKQVIVTTHSPVVLNLVEPRDIFIVSRNAGETSVEPLARLDPDYIAAWEAGESSSFEFLDSGIIPQAVPPQLPLGLSKSMSQ